MYTIETKNDYNDSGTPTSSSLQSAAGNENLPLSGERPFIETFTAVIVLSIFLLIVPSSRPAPEKPILHEHLAAVNLPAAASPGCGAPLIAPVIGKESETSIARGESLLHIARANNTDESTLARINNLSVENRLPGRKLKLPTLHILPCEPAEGVVLNIPERGVYLFRHGQFIRRYPVAVGARTWETPIGTFRIVRKVIDPVWIPPKVMVRREGISSVRIPAGEKNPLGDRWMGWSAPEVGFHGTAKVQSVGQAASHACVRMYPEAAHHMFGYVYRGMPICSIYEPVLIGRKGSGIYLSVFPDIYGRGTATLERAQARLQIAGVWNHVDHEKVRRIVARKEGYPFLIGQSTL